MYACGIVMPLALRFEGWLIFNFYFTFLLLFVLQITDNSPSFPSFVIHDKFPSFMLQLSL